MNKWRIHQDRDIDNPELNSYTLTISEESGGWYTDGGYDGCGLPKDLALWICDILNTYGVNCPYKNCDNGFWEKHE